MSHPPGRVYTAGGNLSWVSQFWTPANVPVIHSAIRMLQSGKFRQPQPLELTVMVGPNNVHHRSSSSLRRLSPEEEHIAYLLATWRDVKAGENMEDWIAFDDCASPSSCARLLHHHHNSLNNMVFISSQSAHQGSKNISYTLTYIDNCKEDKALHNLHDYQVAQIG